MKSTSAVLALLLFLSSGAFVGSIRTNDQTPADGRCSNSNDCQVEHSLDTIVNAGDVAGHNRTINQANEDGRYDLDAPPLDHVVQQREAVDANDVDVGDDDYEEDAVEELGGLGPVPEHEDGYEEDEVEELGRLDPAPEHEDDYEEGDRRINRNLTIDTVASNDESADVTPLLSLLSPAPSLRQERKGLHDRLKGRDGGDFSWSDVANSPSYGSGVTAEGRKYSLRIARKHGRCNTENSTAADLDPIFDNEVGGRPADVTAPNAIADGGTEDAQVMNDDDDEEEYEEGDDNDSDGGGRAVGYGVDIAGGAPVRVGVVSRVRVDIAGAPPPANNANATLEDDRDNNGNGSVDGVGNRRGCMRWMIFILCPLFHPGLGRGKK